MIYNVLKKPDVFYIGKQDENNAETIDIDYSAWVEKYGEGVITATFQGAEDENPYDIVLTTANGIATWTVTDANTVAAGVGKLQLNYVVDEVVAKALWNLGMTDQPKGGIALRDDIDLWLRRHGFKKSTNMSAVREGTVMLVMNPSGSSRHVFVVASKDGNQYKRYDCGSTEWIRSKQPLRGLWMSRLIGAYNL